MGLIIEGVAQSLRDRRCPSIEFLAITRLSSDVALWDAIRAHRSPFIVIVVKPDLGDVFPTVIIPNLVRGKVSVIVEDGLFGRDFVIEMAGSLSL